MGFCCRQLSRGNCCVEMGKNRKGIGLRGQWKTGGRLLDLDTLRLRCLEDCKRECGLDKSRFRSGFWKGVCVGAYESPL